jgi:ribosome-binding factor A
MSRIKQDRMAGRIRVVLSELLLREISDPRLQNITITDVKVDPELMFADVFVNALGDETRQEDVLSGLQRASGFLRRELGKSIRLRTTPELHFHWDVTLERSERINQLIASLNIPPAEPDEIEEEDDDDTDDE